MMNKLLTSLFLSSVITLGGCGLTKENYYVKHVEFPQDATLEQKIDMAARLVPTPQQAAWQQMELTAFLHFGINTFTGREWGDGQEDPAIFNPTELDAEQWVRTLRNARGGDTPNVVKVALDCEAFGADGITVHPRPDERHIRRADVYDLRPLLRTEFNIEGYPSPEFIDLVLKVKPHQVTLVPDDPSQITSNSGWDTKANLEFLSEVLDQFNSAGIRTSVFVAADPEMVEYAAKAGADRVELYTEDRKSVV